MMSEEQTTVAVQRYLDALAGDAPAEPAVRALLDRSARRLQVLCANLLYRGYPRLTLPPVNLQPDELLGAVIERLLKALRAARPQTEREFFALANQHMRWELNDLARRLDNQPAAVELWEGLVPAPASSVSGLSPEGLRMLQAINELQEDEREVFDLVRIQGMTQTEAAQLLGVSAVTVKRRLNRGLRLLTEQLAAGHPEAKSATPSSGSPLRVRYRGSEIRYVGDVLGRSGPPLEVIAFGSGESGVPGFVDSPQAFTVEAGKTKLNTGLDGAIAAMQPGERRVVIVPAAVGYGRAGLYTPETPGKRRFVVSPNALLVYDVEVLTNR